MSYLQRKKQQTSPVQCNLQKNFIPSDHKTMVFQHASRHVCLIQPNLNFLNDSCKLFIIEALDHRRSGVMRYPLSKIGIDEVITDHCIGSGVW